MNVDPGFAYNPTTQTCDDLNPSMLQPYPHHQYQRKHHLPPLLHLFLKLQSRLESALGLEGITRTSLLYKSFFVQCSSTGDPEPMDFVGI